jgi:23S rRNA (guanine2445-N2)-methyltransferase / 23S rRNA (guanine2069-N7)-methyltransferase
MAAEHAYFATCPRGVEALLAAELSEFGAGGVSASRAGVAFTGPLEAGYRACLWSRLASRVLLAIGSFPAADADALYDGARSLPWEEHVAPGATIAVDAVASHSALAHTHFIALKTKDAIVDRLRERTGARPDVRVEQPDVRVNVSVRRDVATVAIDLASESLHRRGYREPGVQTAAPLKESLAAAVLMHAGWPGVAAAHGALVDPLCGSGTLPIEGALIAADVAPGLARAYFGFTGWAGHDAALWAELTREAQARRATGLEKLPPIEGFDADARAVGLARENAKRAGLAGRVRFERRELAASAPPAGAAGGLVVANPPYGQRLGDVATLGGLYEELGRVLRERFDGWTAAVLTSEPELAKRLGLRSKRWYDVYNGPIEARVYTFDVTPSWYKAPVTPAPRGRTAGAEMFANRLRKDRAHLGKWARRTGVTCWRVYDADLPDYNAAIDLYETVGGELWAHVAEYAPPAVVEPERAEARVADIVALVPDVLGVEPERVVLKQRRRQRGTAQYERQAATGEFLTVEEGGLRFLVNLTDYLDTGLFLDHRLTRALVRELAEGRRFLNLFAYTGSASVYAAAGGATSTTTVDMSAVYLDWAKRNMSANGFAESAAHRFERADALRWVAEEARRHPASYDLIFLDPPTFSNSKRMAERTFEAQRDHAELLRDVARLLAPGGEIVFSSNDRRFRLDETALPGLVATDITKRTLPEDFARNPRIHRCFRIEASGS